VVRDIATKTQSRLCGRYRALSNKGKRLTVAVTAIARELAGFVWTIGREVRKHPWRPSGGRCRAPGSRTARRSRWAG
jgi:hypothetical protein